MYSRMDLSDFYEDQSKASRSVLEDSQCDVFPFTIDALGLKILVNKGVFSPKHFHGWEVYTKYFPTVLNESVLEIGCGTGITAIYLAKNGAKNVVAVDINPNAIANTKENVTLNKANNVEVRESDIFSNIESDEQYHTIYWNLPFIYKPSTYKYKSMLERSLFDPGYQYIEKFLMAARNHLINGGRILVGLGDFADLKRFHSLAKRYGYAVQLISAEKSVEVNPIEFQLYELKEIS